MKDELSFEAFGAHSSDEGGEKVLALIRLADLWVT